MLAISAQELTDMRSEMAATWPDTAQVSRITADTPSAMGGRTRTRSVVATVACRLIPRDREDPKSIEQPQDRLINQERWTVLLPAGTDVRITDRLIINGVSYEVIDDTTRRSDALCDNVTTVLAE